MGCWFLLVLSSALAACVRCRQVLHFDGGFHSLFCSLFLSHQISMSPFSPYPLYPPCISVTSRRGLGKPWKGKRALFSEDAPAAPSGALCNDTGSHVCTPGHHPARGLSDMGERLALFCCWLYSVRLPFFGGLRGMCPGTVQSFSCSVVFAFLTLPPPTLHLLSTLWIRRLLVRASLCCHSISTTLFFLFLLFSEAPATDCAPAERTV
jgi:hypothetical protein